MFSLNGDRLEVFGISINIDDLINFGYDIFNSPKGAYLVSRDFEEGEIRFLIDAVFSSKVISSKYAQELSKKISSFLSEYKQNDYDYILKSSDVVRTNNRQLFFNIEQIGRAIKQNKKIEFNYTKGSYFAEKKIKSFKVSPYFLVNNHSNNNLNDY